MSDFAPYAAVNVSLVCPVCSHRGTFYGHEKANDIQSTKGSSLKRSGIRICPNTICNAIIFYSNAYDQEKKSWVADVYPKALIDFDRGAIPLPIIETFDEALKCHAAGCFRASAVMIRRTLEEICEDRKCAGKDLHQRLEKLKDSVIIPSVLLDAAFSLKLLGNDAVHIEAKSYNNIGKDEIEIAIELTKELLKATYQYSTLIGKLNSLKK